MIYPKEVIDATGDGQLKEFVGTGPFKFVEHKPDRHVKLARFDGYVPRSEPASGLAGRRVAYLDELVVKTQQETGATFFIITHNIPSVMRTAEFMGILFRSGLEKFGSREDMKTTDNRVIRQFLSGRAKGPIGMDEMADEDTTGVQEELEALAPPNARLELTVWR